MMVSGEPRCTGNLEGWWAGGRMVCSLREEKVSDEYYNGERRGSDKRDSPSLGE
jgi:hypothetical protein